MSISNGGGGGGLAYKTKGISKVELTYLLTDSEQYRLDKAKSLIEGDLSWIAPPNVVGFDIDSEAILLQKSGCSYRDVLRTSFERYKDAPYYDVDHPDYIAGWQLHAFLGLLDGPERIAVLMKGVPLSAQ